MIGYIKGVLDAVYEDRIIVENNNIGFEIFVPGSVLETLPMVNNSIKIYTYMNVREDDISLYGFTTKDQLDMFKLLITVNGIGPKGGLGILTAMDVDSLRLAIMSDDAKLIAKSPGIGAKTASKLILELKDKIDITSVFDSNTDKSANANLNISVPKNEAIEALVALGYSASEATQAVVKVDITENMTVEQILKQSLKNM